MPRNPISPACVAAKSDIIITLPGGIWSATPRLTIPSSYARRNLWSASPRSGMARGPASRQQRRAGLRRGRLGDALSAVGGLLRILATRAGRLDQPPTDHPRDPDPRDCLLGSAERTEQRLLNPFTSVVVGRRYGLDPHDPLRELARRHRLGGLAQFVVDQPQALTRTEPGVACSRLFRTDVLRPEVWIEQPHGGI